MTPLRGASGLLICLWLAAAPAAAQDVPPTWAEAGALFAERCVKCHSGFDAPMGLSLDTYAAALLGSWDGKILLPGDAATSPLMRRIRGEATPRMPLDGPPFLEPAEIALIEAWVLAGLPEGDAAAAPPAVADRARPGPGEPVLWSDIEPILQRRCIKCHSDNSRLGGPPEGLRLVDLAAVLAGGDRLAVLPGNPEMSELWRRVAGLGEPRMPFDGPPWLEDADIRLIRDWIVQGAPDGTGAPAPIPVGAELRLRGRLTAPDAIDGARFTVTGATRIDDLPGTGGAAELRGVVEADGAVRALRLRGR